MNFIDYYFYRMYKIYQEKNEFARSATCMLLSKLFLLFVFFTSLFITHYVTGDFFVYGIQDYIIYLALFGIPILYGIITYNYYSKSRIKKIQKKYKDSRCNNIISDKLILAVPYIELSIGLFIWFLIASI